MAGGRNRGNLWNKIKLNKPPCLAALVLLVSLCSLAFTSYVKVTFSETLTVRNVGKSSVCVRCELLDDQSTYVKAVLQELVTIVVEGDEKKCCVQTLEELQAMLQFLAAAKTTDSEDSSVPAFVKSADLPLNGVFAHKKLNLLNEDGDDSGTSTMFQLGMTPEDNSGELTKDVIVTPQGIIILHTGLYYVYINIKFSRLSDRPCGYRNVTSWHYSVVKSRPGDRQQSGNILYAPNICCKNCSSEHETSYTAGLFHLQASDHLHVEMSSPARVSFDKSSSFLGLLMMGSRAPS